MGGKSSRMGTDKSQLVVSLSDFASGRIVPKAEQDQRTTLAELAQSKLKCYVDEVYFSINTNQKHLELSNTIIDRFEEEGPLSGIISALKTLQQSILVIGVDMPLVTKQSIKKLIKHRDWDLLSTTYYNNETKIWEPMLSIWEIEALPCIEEYFDSGERSFQKFLNKFGNQPVPITDEKEFTNVNTMEEYEKISLT